jgi:hypothetical protein
LEFAGYGKARNDEAANWGGLLPRNYVVGFLAAFALELAIVKIDINR